MKLKDFVKIVLFGILGFVFSMVGGMVTTLFGAYGLFVHAAFGSILMGAVYVTLIKKVPHRFTVFFFYLVVGLIFAAFGFAAFIVFMLLIGIVGELCHLGAGEYSSDRKITLSYIVSQTLYGIHPLLFFMILGIDGINRFFPGMFDAETAKFTMNFYQNPMNSLIVIMIQLAASVIGVKIGLAIYRKFFAKSKGRAKLED